MPVIRIKQRGRRQRRQQTRKIVIGPTSVDLYNRGTEARQQNSVDQLTGMGFSTEQAVTALSATNCDVEAAVMFLLSQTSHTLNQPEPAEIAPSQQPSQPAKPCTFFARGCCRNGSNCSFLHPSVATASIQGGSMQSRRKHSDSAGDRIQRSTKSRTSRRPGSSTTRSEITAQQQSCGSSPGTQAEASTQELAHGRVWKNMTKEQRLATGFRSAKEHASAREHQLAELNASILAPVMDGHGGQQGWECLCCLVPLDLGGLRGHLGSKKHLQRSKRANRS
eukprot:TRINITY_DN16738_c0_g2_i1.p1 TRINITY_DN16738_c0_g2~~TRINITY_DN16738_c0_g2_i1.p1  ORF type:complete len:279 (-),score=29.57 TRINITY_DN16738_c0_g2_i1:320-1156(-)